MQSYRRNHLGNQFRAHRGTNLPPRYSTEEVQRGQATVLQARFGREKSPSEALRELSGSCERAARNHLSGATSMNLATFFNACQAIPELKKWGLRMMGHDAALDPMFEAEVQGLIQAYYRIKDRKPESPE